MSITFFRRDEADRSAAEPAKARPRIGVALGAGVDRHAGQKPIGPEFGAKFEAFLLRAVVSRHRPSEPCATD